MGLSVLVLLTSATGFAAEFLLSDFNNSGFSYTWNFTPLVGPTAVRMTDLTQGWGGGGLNASLDLTPFADGRVVVDFEKHLQHSASTFTIELYDDAGNSGKWPFSIVQQPTSQSLQVVHQDTLSNPPEGVGDFANLDLANIVQWQVLGEFGSTSPFDLSFDNLGISTTAVPTSSAYLGREANAAWRSEAATRIDQLRKADLQIHVVDKNGIAIPNASVTTQMQAHEFGFGSVVKASRLASNTAENQVYKNKVRQLFNQAVLENGLKWRAWEGDFGDSFSPQKSVAALHWLAAEDIEARGHVMVWPGYDNLPNSMQALLDTTPMTPAVHQSIRDAIAAHIADIGSVTDGLVRDWDVVNEPRVNHDIMDTLPEGYQSLVSWFQAADAIDPEAKLYLNEYGILSSSGATNTGNQQLLISTLNDLIAGGAPIDGVGLQGHFDEVQLSGPEQLWTILDDIGQTGLDIQITEFDFRTDDLQLQADYTRDFLTAIFAHEDVTDFMLWGFFENSHWRPEAALFNADWSIKPNGEAYMDLVFDEWWTDEVLSSGSIGEALIRGFKGGYEIEASYGDVTATRTEQLVDGGTSVTVSLDLLLGDFDNSGNYTDSDVNTLVSLIASGIDLEQFDITGDGLVNRDDLDAWLTYAGGNQLGTGNAFRYGDANLDGIVDEFDFEAWNSNRFQTGVGWGGGDFNADGIADISDFGLWNTNRGLVPVSFVPEPEQAVWLLLVLVWAAGFARRRTFER